MLFISDNGIVILWLVKDGNDCFLASVVSSNVVASDGIGVGRYSILFREMSWLSMISRVKLGLWQHWIISGIFLLCD